MKKLIFLIMLGSAFPTYGANNLHVFKVSHETYSELSNDIEITTQVFDDGWHHFDFLSGESFRLFNRTWTMDTSRNYIGIYKCGRVAIMNDTVFALLDGMYADSIQLIDAASKISYKLEGSGNKKVLKIQWKNLRVGYGPSGNYFNVQIWIYQEDGLVEFRYGDRSSNNASGYKDPAKGLYIGIWHSQEPNFYAVYEKINLKGTPPAIIVDSIRNVVVPNIQGLPESGTVYRFIPKTSKLSTHFIGQVKVQSYPSPADHELRVETDELISDASLIDLQGKEVCASILVSSGLFKFNTATLPDGLYILQIRRGTQLIHRKVLIRHN